uniref:Glycoprotein H=KEX2/subtilisin-related protease (Fragments) n=1 Tax=Bos taurus TaxID=9913 RepID=Q9TSB5_BOVIN
DSALDLFNDPMLDLHVIPVWQGVVITVLDDGLEYTDDWFNSHGTMLDGIVTDAIAFEYGVVYTSYNT